ncbi:hypothetical protein [Carnobacterium divergens]|uniref:hypothetical protein n=1 Tax=Carnobacterium divergens TaxID=2748 RepID=UPI0039C8C0FF
MSHFTVAVISKKGTPEEVEKLLAPFDENKEVPHYISKEEIITIERNKIEEYKNETYKEYLDNPEKYSEGCGESHLNYVKNEFPKKLKWTDEELYQEGIRYEEETIQPDGSVFSSYNPKSEWDWYQIGGRWKGLLRKKNGLKVDSCKIDDLDLSKDKEMYDKAIRYWEVVVDHSEIKEEENKADFGSFYNEGYFVRTFGTKEQYAEIQSSLRTYALITPEGEWLSKGKMGWFGLSDESKESVENYNELFVSTIEKNKDCFITIVDCHI